MKKQTMMEIAEYVDERFPDIPRVRLQHQPEQTIMVLGLV